MRAKLVGGMVALCVLACSGSGPEETGEVSSPDVHADRHDENEAPRKPGSDDAAAADWIEDAIDEALEMEVMPGTTEEPDGTPERREALRAFFVANSQYEDPAKREALSAHACGLEGVEAAHEYLTNPPKKTPTVITDDRDDWVVFASYRNFHCTSDDWGWYVSEASMAAQDLGAKTGHADPDSDVIVIMSKGKEVARISVPDVGLVLVKNGSEPLLFDIEPGVNQQQIADYLAE